MPQLPEESLTDWLARIAARSQEKDVQAASQTLAERMVAWVNVGNQKTWRQAAAKSLQSQKLYQLLQREMQGATGRAVQRLIAENARYISSVPVEAARTLVDEVTKAQQSGARAGMIDKMLRNRFPELLRSRTKLIARTETAKASTALTQARCEELDLDWYEWLTSDDVRVRPSHKNLAGVIVPWADPPSPEALVGEKAGLGHYHAGACPNCRCSQAPVMSLDDVKFPARVYWAGRVQRMTKQQFKQIAVRLESRAA
jgi:SPP1 gp7 family putative phage head morphogenesis protein